VRRPPHRPKPRPKHRQPVTRSRRCAKAGRDDRDGKTYGAAHPSPRGGWRGRVARRPPTGAQFLTFRRQRDLNPIRAAVAGLPGFARPSRITREDPHQISRRALRSAPRRRSSRQAAGKPTDIGRLEAGEFYFLTEGSGKPAKFARRCVCPRVQRIRQHPNRSWSARRDGYSSRRPAHVSWWISPTNALRTSSRRPMSSATV
jgi:hypothetical protein